MVFSKFTQNLRGPWMIHPEQAAVMLPVLKGVLEGYITEFDKPKSAVRISCSDFYTGGTVPSGMESKSIYVTYLEGTMLKYDYCGEPGTRRIADELLKADRDNDIVGHIIVADSGGGNADSVPDLADAIRQLEKPVVAYIDGMAASACIYAISYTDRIIAHQPTDMVGCIGTMIEISGYSKYHKSQDGYIRCRIYADASSEKNADYEAALEGNAQIIKEEMLNPLAEKFIADMKANRPGVQDSQLIGKTYFARDVVGTLIDSIGTFNDAVKTVLDLASEQTKTSTDMAKYKNLENIPSLKGQVYGEDGSTTLQECQLQDIEAALETGSAASGMNATVEELNSRISGLEGTIAERDARIAELEASLAAAIEKSDGDDVAPKKDPTSAEDDYKPAKTFDEAMDACRAFLSK